MCGPFEPLSLEWTQCILLSRSQYGDLATAFPSVRPRSAPILLRASAFLPATKRLTGITSAVVPPPPMHDDEKGA